MRFNVHACSQTRCSLKTLVEHRMIKDKHLQRMQTASPQKSKHRSHSSRHCWKGPEGLPASSPAFCMCTSTLVRHTCIMHEGVKACAHEEGVHKLRHVLYLTNSRQARIDECKHARSDTRIHPRAFVFRKCASVHLKT